MAGPALGPALAQGAAAGTQGQGILLQQLLAQLAARSRQQQIQQTDTQNQGQGGAYDAISALFGGTTPGAPQTPQAPPPGQPSAPAQPDGVDPRIGDATVPPGVAGPLQQAAPAAQAMQPQVQSGGAPSPARAVLQGGTPQPQPQQPAPQSQSLPNMIAAIDKAMPNAPPQAKMAALEKVSGLMTSQAQVEFARMRQTFEMQMQVAKLTEQANNHLQMSMDRNASVEQRAQAAQQHSATMAAIAQLASSDRRYGADSRADTASRADDTRRRGQDIRADNDALNRALKQELGEKKLDLDKVKVENLQAYRDEVVRLKDAGLSQRSAEMEARERIAAAVDATRRRGQDVTSGDRRYGIDTRSADKAADRQARSEIAERGFQLRDRIQSLKLTPDQQLLGNQLKSLTSRYDAIINSGAGPKSPQALAFDSQIKQLTAKLEQSLGQPGPGPGANAPTPATTDTRPPMPPDIAKAQGEGKEIQYNAQTREYRVKPEGAAQ